MDCIVALVKYGIFIFNFVLLCFGVFLIVAGASFQSFELGLQNFHEFVDDMSTTSKVLIILGIIVCIISFFGCWGAFAENTGYLKMYAVFLLLIILLEVVFGMFIFFKRSAIENDAKEIIKTAMEEYDTKDSSKELVDTFQSSLKCCGNSGPSDWTAMGKSIPTSCCPKAESSGTTPACEKSKAYQDGCLPKAKDLIFAIRSKIMWLIACVIGFEAIVIFFTLLVRNSILDSRRMMI